DGTAVPTFVVGGAGNDLFTVGDPANFLGNMRGPIAVVGEGGNDLLLIDETASPPSIASLSRAVTVSSPGREFGQVQWSMLGQSPVRGLVSFGQSIYYASIANLEIHGNDARTNFNVAGTIAGTPVTIRGGVGDDTFRVGDTSHSLDGLASPVTLDG